MWLIVDSINDIQAVAPTELQAWLKAIRMDGVGVSMTWFLRLVNWQKSLGYRAVCVRGA